MRLTFFGRVPYSAEDNAVDLAFTLSGLQDNFSTADFEELRRNALTALLVACPTRSAPYV